MYKPQASSVLESLTGVLSLSSQCRVSPLVSQWIWIVRTTLPSCLGMPVRARWSITDVPELRVETPSTVTALLLPAPLKASNVVKCTISLWKPPTASATARLVHL